ncbi:MAG: hypothetical protein P8N02_03090 [Actinomycetota bacterium]|jgi:hypothetical protein|nr:hypothetical protein [Actinomycetota bacterium]
MEAYFRRAAAVISELTGDQAGAFVTVDVIADGMQQEWPELFPRPKRIIAGWCSTAVEKGLLVVDSPDRGLRVRREWGELRYAVA